MPFAMVRRVGPRNRVVDGVDIGPPGKYDWTMSVAAISGPATKSGEWPVSKLVWAILLLGVIK